MMVCFKNVPKELEFALLQASARLGFTLGDGECVEIKKIERGLKVEKNLICYSSIGSFLRALGIFLGGGTACEQCAFSELGVMLDLSRNAVATLSTIKDYAFTLACMGYNELKLYTEDTFIVQNQPYFGYMRGALTASELKAADSFCAKVGIELVPCVQTLAHLNQLTRYNRYNEFFDCNDILLAEDERTYNLIEDIFATLADCFTSRKVNIGMDEAHMLGLGKYLDQHGYTKRFDIMIKHLTKVRDIAKKYGFKCEMWSDMFFRLLGNGYSADNMNKMPKEVIDNLPADVTLVYWDYYSLDYNRYNNMLKSHFMLTKNVAFAGGCWKWSGITPENTFSIAANTQNIKACIDNNVSSYFTTSWGDDGAEASHFSVLPALYDVCQKAYKSEDYSSFSVIAGISFEDFLKVDKLNKLTVESEYKIANPSKYMLFNDILQGTYDSCCAGAGEIYKKMLPEMQSVANREFKFSYIFKTLAALNKALVLKAELGIKIKKAYDVKDIPALKELAQKEIPQTIIYINEFYDLFKKQWNIENKGFGQEVQALRIGGLVRRLEDVCQTLLDYANKKIDIIYELEIERLPYNNGESNMSNLNCNVWNIIASTSKI